MMLGWWLISLFGSVEGSLIGFLNMICGCWIVVFVLGFLLMSVVS